MYLSVIIIHSRVPPNEWVRLLRNLRIGVVGYCPPSVFNEAEAVTKLNRLFEAVLRDHHDSDRQVTVVSRWSNVGIPALAYCIAKERGWRTAGIACRKVFNYERFPVDESRVVGEQWGDESHAFLADITVLVGVGGGPQSLDEMETFGSTYGRDLVYYEDLARLNA